MAERKAGEFHISLTIWQDHWTPDEISRRLSIQPRHTGVKGQNIAATVKRRRGIWIATLAEGTQRQEFADALERIWLLLSSASECFSELQKIPSEAEILMDLWESREDEPAQLWLNADLLRACGDAGISLKVKLWNANSSE